MSHAARALFRTLSSARIAEAAPALAPAVPIRDEWGPTIRKIAIPKWSTLLYIPPATRFVWDRRYRVAAIWAQQTDALNPAWVPRIGISRPDGSPLFPSTTSYLGSTVPAIVLPNTIPIATIMGPNVDPMRLDVDVNTGDVWTIVTDGYQQGVNEVSGIDLFFFVDWATTPRGPST